MIRLGLEGARIDRKVMSRLEKGWEKVRKVMNGSGRAQM